jgi:hypothetical protein
VFERKDLQELYNNIINTKFDLINGVIQAGWLENTMIDVAGSKIRIGIGGSHSSEEGVSYYEDDEYELIDADIASMYPAWIINRGLYPELIGKVFSKVYTSIRDRRLIAKKNKDKVTDAVLKICANGSYGKLGSRYSILYSPETLLSTTIGGQMCMLMLCERIERNGWFITSNNTDGITLRIKRTERENLIKVIEDWENQTLYKMEYTFYKSTHSLNINNYIAIKTDGSIKRKGCFSEDSLSKNARNTICNDAICAYLQGESSIEEHIYSCTDIRKFLTVRNVTGGAIKDTEYLGKTVRFYHSTSTNTAIHYAKNGSLVNTSDKSRPMMKLTKDIPIDLDYNWYVNEAYIILKDIGIKYDLTQ